MKGKCCECEEIKDVLPILAGRAVCKECGFKHNYDFWKMSTMTQYRCDGTDDQWKMLKEMFGDEKNG